MWSLAFVGMFWNLSANCLHEKLYGLALLLLSAILILQLLCKSFHIVYDVDTFHLKLSRSAGEKKTLINSHHPHKKPMPSSHALMPEKNQPLVFGKNGYTGCSPHWCPSWKEKETETTVIFTTAIPSHHPWLSMVVTSRKTDKAFIQSRAEIESDQYNITLTWYIF